MRTAGLVLLLAGWGLVLSAMVLLPSGATRVAFVAAGLGVQVFGLVLALRRSASQEEAA